MMPSIRTRCSGVDRKSWNPLNVLLVVFALLIPLGLHADGILIFSTSHSNDSPTLLYNATGTLTVEISTFTPIVELAVNGEPKTVNGDTRMKLDIPYRLKKGTNRFEIYVQTEETDSRKAYVLEYEPKKEAAKGKKEKAPFQLLAVIGLQISNNAAQVSEDEEGAQKLIVTLIPIYRLDLQGDSKVEFKGTLLREKFLDSDFASKELVYTKLEAGWLNKAGFGDWTLVGGYYDTGSENSGFSAESEVETGTFAEGRFKLNALDKKKVELSVAYALKDQPDGLTSDYDGDGGALRLQGVWNKEFGTVNGKFTLAYLMNDAKGKYKDYNRISFELYGEMPLSKKMSVGGLYKTKQLTYSENDPIKGDQEQSTTSTLVAGLKYKMSLLGGMILIGTAEQENKASNIESFEYSETAVTVSAAFVF